MNTYLVTGGAGFIGSHLTRRLVDDGDRVRVLDDLSTGRRENLDGVFDRIEFIEGDIADAAVCARACRGIDVVFHQAAVPSVPKSVDDPAASHRANVEGTFRLLMAARGAGVRRFVNAASSSAYGESPTLPKAESLPPEPLSPYAVQKLTGEHYCRVFNRCYGLPAISLRYFNVFGPRQNPRSQYAAAIPAFISAILRDEPPTVYGDGEQTRDFTYIDNAVEANLAAARAANVRGEAVNIACGQRISVNQVIAEINRLLGKNVRARYVEERPGDIRHSCADIRLAEQLIGYCPRVDFATGLKRTIDWFAGLERSEVD